MTRFWSAFAVAAGVFAVAADPAAGTTFTLAGAADTVAVSPGGSVTLDFVLRDVSPPFNAFDIIARFDPALLTNTPLSPLSAQRGSLMTSACLTNSPFHLFTPTPDSLTCTLVILCSGVSVTGPGTLYRVRFTAAATDAWTTVSFGPSTMFYIGGPVVDTLVTKPIVVKIGSPLLDAGSPRLPAAPELDPVAPNPGRGSRRLPVSFRLPRAATAELALLDVLGRRVALAERAPFTAGPQHVALDLPRLSPGRYTLVLRTDAGETSTRPWVVLR